MRAINFRFISQLFRFNAHDDRLELCLEPCGHFAIEPGIEARVNNTSLIDVMLNRKHLPPGASGVVSGAGANTSQSAFQGLFEIFFKV